MKRRKRMQALYGGTNISLDMLHEWLSECILTRLSAVLEQQPKVVVGGGGGVMVRYHLRPFLSTRFPTVKSVVYRKKQIGWSWKPCLCYSETILCGTQWIKGPAVRGLILVICLFSRNNKTWLITANFIGLYRCFEVLLWFWVSPGSFLAVPRCSWWCRFLDDLTNTITGVIFTQVSVTHTEMVPFVSAVLLTCRPGRTEVALSRDVGGISTPRVPLCAALLASGQTATLPPPPPLQIPNTLSSSTRFLFRPPLFSSGALTRLDNRSCSPPTVSIVAITVLFTSGFEWMKRHGHYTVFSHQQAVCKRGLLCRLPV